MIRQYLSLRYNCLCLKGLIQSTLKNIEQYSTRYSGSIKIVTVVCTFLGACSDHVVNLLLPATDGRVANIWKMF